MSEREPQSHWDSLVSQLGADPQLPPPQLPATQLSTPSGAMPSKAEAPKEKKRPKSVPNVRPPTTDWTAVAKGLDIASEPLTTESIRWRKSEPTDPPPAAEGRQASFEKETATTDTPSASVAPRPRRAPVEEEAAESKAPPPLQVPAGGFAAGLFETTAAGESPSESPTPAWLEEVEGEPDEKPRKRRKRRGRSRSGRSAQRAEASETGAESAEAKAADGSDDAAVAGEESPGEDRRRPRRRKRRRSRPTEDRQTGDSALGDDDTAVVDEAEEAGDENHEPSSSKPKSREAAHRNIPSWEEAIGMIVNKNMEGRSRSRSSSSHRSRGRGRGRS